MALKYRKTRRASVAYSFKSDKQILQFQIKNKKISMKYHDTSKYINFIWEKILW